MTNKYYYIDFKDCEIYSYIDTDTPKKQLLAIVPKLDEVQSKQLLDFLLIN